MIAPAVLELPAEARNERKASEKIRRNPSRQKKRPGPILLTIRYDNNMFPKVIFQISLPLIPEERWRPILFN